MFYALGYLFGCYGNYRRYVSAALTDARIEQQLQEWAETEPA